MANPLITLQGLDKPQGVNALAAGISQGNEIARMPIQNRLLEAQAQGAEQQISKQQAEFMLRDAALDAMRGASLLEADPSGAALKDFLQNERMAKLVGRGSKDTTDTQGIIQAIDAGNLDFVRSELNAPIEAATRIGLVKPGIGDMPEELKVGRFRQITLPDGSIASLDTATNSVTPIAEAQSLDLSSVPEDMRESVSRQPREVQQKIVEAYTSPAGREKELKSQEQEAKAQEVTNKTKSLVSELLNNISGLKAVTGGLDEMTPTFLPGSKDAEAALEDLRNLLTVENLDLMSGVLSESDIKILKSVGASGLSGSQERVIKTLQNMGAALGVSGGGQVGRFKVRVK